MNQHPDGRRLMTTPPGIVRPSAPVPRASGHVVRVGFDLREHRFLRDHLVNGRPLLSTVMGIETIGAAVRAVRPGAVVAAMSGIRVGPPYFVPVTGTGEVEVSLVEWPGDAVLHCQVRDRLGADPGDVHILADVVTAEAPLTAPSPGRTPGAPAAGRAAPGSAVYDLFFHGESFRVIDSAWFDDDVVVGRLARELPSIVEPARPSVMAPLLIELCLQTAGLWELAGSGRMMIPRSIERIVRHTSADSSTPGLTAVVRPRAVDGSPGEYAFDATVVDEDATVHLSVLGYRTTEFPHPHDVAAAARIRQALGEPLRFR